MKYIITGSTNGLGYCLTQKAIKKYDAIGISKTNKNSIPALLLNSNKYKHIELDLSMNEIDFEQQVTLSSYIKNKDQITLILNAGIFNQTFDLANHKINKNLFQINLFNNINLVKELLTFNLRRVIFINSISGLITQNNQPDYSASKAALQSYSNSLALYAKDKDFDVMSINPGGINTSLWEKQKKHVDPNLFMNPDELSEIVFYLSELKSRFFVKNLTILPPVDVN